MSANPGVALATSSALAADAGRQVSELGGNACDVATAAALITANTEPGVCALAGGGFVTVGRSAADTVTIDGNVAVPGREGTTSPTEGRVVTVDMQYGGGTTTLIGPGSVAVPGTLAALECAWRREGQLPWATIMQPCIEAARNGFPLPGACHYYLQYSAEPIFSAAADARLALLNEDDQLHSVGEKIVIPHLADTLESIAREGSACFYRGDIANTIVTWVSERGGSLTAADLAFYEPVVRQSARKRFGDWTLATNPPPAIGGAMVLSMLGGILERPTDTGNEALLDAMERALRYRHAHLDNADNLFDATEVLLRQSASTVHTSAVDSDGLACAITLSAGYGSGEMPAGTGLQLNNCLGEIDLNKPGLDAAPVGRRLISNMAPTVAFSGSNTLAIGSPGASRITTALCQVLGNYFAKDMSLAEAVAAARAHVEIDSDNVAQIYYESGFEMPNGRTGKCYENQNMYFGGVGGALKTTGNFVVAADPRRDGGTYVTKNDL